MRQKLVKILILILIMSSCSEEQNLAAEVFETSASGHQLTKLDTFKLLDSISTVIVDPSKEFQTITGFGGAFTESSAYLLNQLSDENRKKQGESLICQNTENVCLCVCVELYSQPW